MNKYTIKVANIEAEGAGYNEYNAIMATGLFTKADLEDYFGNYEGKDAWSYRVELNGVRQMLIVRRK